MNVVTGWSGPKTVEACLPQPGSAWQRDLTPNKP